MNHKKNPQMPVLRHLMRYIFSLYSSIPGVNPPLLLDDSLYNITFSYISTHYMVCAFRSFAFVKVQGQVLSTHHKHVSLCVRTLCAPPPPPPPPTPTPHAV